jgi:hypothetical protein
VRVAETFRGAATGDVDIWTGAGGGDCGFSFKAGESYVIYARRESSGRLSTSICTRTRTAANAAEDLAYLRGPMREPVGLGRIVGRAELDGEVRPWDRTPVQGARVIAEGGGRTYEARSAADGTYELRVPTGKYTLRAEVPDGALTASIQPRAEDRGSPYLRTRGCRRPLERPRLWAHRRRRPRAARGVCRRARARERSRRPGRRRTYVTRTDDRGRFAFGMMPPGRYYVAYDRRRASTPKPGPLFAVPGGTLFSFELTRGGEAPLADLALPADVRAIRISGVVSGADGSRSAARSSASATPARQTPNRLFRPSPTTPAASRSRSSAAGDTRSSPRATRPGVFRAPSRSRLTGPPIGPRSRSSLFVRRADDGAIVLC